MAVNACQLSNLQSSFACRSIEKSKAIVSSSHFGGKVLTPTNMSNGVQSRFDRPSLYFNGTSSKLVSAISADFRFGTGPFTIEWWMYLTAPWDTVGTGSIGIIGQKAGDSFTGWQVYRDGGYPTKINFRLGLQNNFPSVSTPSVGIWEHWAICRNETALTWYKDGIAESIQTNSYNTNESVILNIGFSQTWSGYFGGYLDDIRISNIARYTNDFTPPTVPFAYDANTKLLVNASGPYIIDRTFQ